MPHNTSPFTILDHRFLEVSVRASENPAPEAQYDLKTRSEVSASEYDPLEWTVVLEISFGATNEDQLAPYTGKIVIRGSFKIRESFTEKNREALIRVSAASILYGASREMVANMTARSINGILSLPSISFRKQGAEPDEK